MRGRCFNCGSSSHIKRDCPHSLPAGSASAKPTSSTTASDAKKVSKVKASSKSSPSKDSKVSADDENDSEKGGPQQKGETIAPADATPPEPMGEPATGAASDLMREATGLLRRLLDWSLSERASLDSLGNLRFLMEELLTHFDRRIQMRKLTWCQARWSWPVDQLCPTSTRSTKPCSPRANYPTGVLGGGWLPHHLAPG